MYNMQVSRKETICLQLPLGNKTVELYYIRETHFFTLNPFPY